MDNEKCIIEANLLPIGFVLQGRYRIDKYLSSGGFGNTYLVTHLELHSLYAIKEFFMKGILSRSKDGASVCVSSVGGNNTFEEQLEKFKKEAYRLSLLNNEHIVKVYDLFEENGTAYYVMDYVNGSNLNQIKTPLAEKEVFSIAFQILDALQNVHLKNIWHLDLKPANIMMDDKGVIKLIDFGASKQLNIKKGGATTGTALCFTTGYAPLEQMEQSYNKLGPWTDFYALGATLYNLLTCNKPPLPSDIVDDISDDKHTALPLPLGISERMKLLILWLMKPNRQERPASAQEIWNYLNSSYSNINEGATLLMNRKEQKTKGRKVLYFVGCFLLFVAISLSIFVILKDVKVNKNVVSSPIPHKNESNAVNKSINIILPEGECTYIGEIDAKGIPNGYGQAWFKDGRYYKGIFKKGNMSGENAFFSDREGNVFEGEFKDNHFHKGIYTLKATGEYFRGTFDTTGAPLSGQWYDDKGNLIQSM